MEKPVISTSRQQEFGVWLQNQNNSASNYKRDTKSYKTYFEIIFMAISFTIHQQDKCKVFIEHGAMEISQNSSNSTRRFLES